MARASARRRSTPPAVRRAAAGRSAAAAAGVLRSVAVLYIGILVAVPLALVFQRTIADGADAFWDAISAPDAVHAFKITAEIALIAVAINTVFGLGMALLLARYRFAGRRLLNVLLDIPVSVSPIVVGLALVLVYGPTQGWFGPSLSDAGVQVIFALPGMVLATCFVSLPLVVREIVPVLQEEGLDQEHRGPLARRQLLAAVRPDHAADDPLGPRVRRGAQPGPGHRRVRRGPGRLRRRDRADPDGHRCGSATWPSRASRAPTRSRSCWCCSPSSASSASRCCGPRRRRADGYRGARRHQAVRRLRRTVRCGPLGAVAAS